MFLQCKSQITIDVPSDHLLTHVTKRNFYQFAILVINEVAQLRGIFSKRTLKPNNFTILCRRNDGSIDRSVDRIELT